MKKARQLRSTNSRKLRVLPTQPRCYADSLGFDTAILSQVRHLVVKLTITVRSGVWLHIKLVWEFLHLAGGLQVKVHAMNHNPGSRLTGNLSWTFNFNWSASCTYFSGPSGLPAVPRHTSLAQGPFNGDTVTGQIAGVRLVGQFLHWAVVKLVFDPCSVTVIHYSYTAD